MNRFLPIILLLSILFNIGCVLVFRLRLDRRYSQRFKEYSAKTTQSILDIAADSMSRIDAYFVSNHFSKASSVDASLVPQSPFYTNILEWEYDFCIVDDLPYIIRGSNYYTIGDTFPRGGVITAISDDCIVLDGRYSVNNTKYKKIGEANNEFGHDTLRQ